MAENLPEPSPSLPSPPSVIPPMPPPPESLGYSLPRTASRPGLITAIGVISIVVACLSGIGSFGMGMYGVGFYVITRMTGAMPAPPPSPPTPAPTTTTSGAVPTGFSSTGFTEMVPAAGSAQAPPTVTLTPIQIQGVVQRVQSQTSNALNPAQVAALQSALQAPNQQLVLQGTTWSPVQSAFAEADGTVSIQLTGDSLQIDPAGKVVTAAASVGKPFPFPTHFNISPVACALVIADGALSIALAIYLLVIGIMVLRQSPRGRRLHFIYVFLKIPLAIAGPIAFMWMFSGFLASATSFSPGGSSPGTFVYVIWGVVLVVLAAAYPVGLLFALNARTVRDYYNSVASGA